MFSSPDIANEIAQLQREGKLPSGLSPAQTAALEKALNKSTGEVDERILAKLLDQYKEQAGHMVSQTEPEARRTLLADLGNFMEGDVADSIYRTLDKTQTLFRGAGTYLSQNLSPEAVNNYPGLALARMFERDVPRGDKRVKGAIEVNADPDDAWPARWQEAGEACGDDDWLEWEGDAQSGRGVALKSSAIWETLGNLRDDSIGNAFAPFAWESGFRTTSVSRDTCVELGLIEPNEAAQPARFTMADLFPTP